MTEEEKVKKLIDANEDLNKGQIILENLSFGRYQQAKDYVDNCCKNTDYAPYIAKNRAMDGMFGNLGFIDLKPLIKRKVLKMIINSIEEYIAELTLKDSK